MKDGNKILLIIGIVFLALLIYNPTIFSIVLKTPQTVYFNKPILIEFQTENFTDPVLNVYLNDVRLYEVLSYQVDETVWTEVFNETTNSTMNVSSNIKVNKTYSQNVELSTGKTNETYFIRINNLSSSGVIKFTLTEGNKTETQTVEVRKAFVDIKTNIPNLADEGVSLKIEIKTFTPQGDVLEADSVDVDVIDPSNTKTSLSFTKSVNVFSYTFNYADAGNYQFKIYPRKDGFDTKEFTVITSVAKKEGVHPIIYVFGFIFAIWLILFIIKRVRVK